MRYKVYQSHANNGTKGKFYLRPVYDETVELDQLADHMASHNTPFSRRGRVSRQPPRSQHQAQSGQGLGGSADTEGEHRESCSAIINNQE